MKGEKTKIRNYLLNKTITITAVNHTDKRMLSMFMAKRKNYWGKFRDLKWVSDNLIENKLVIRTLGVGWYRDLNNNERIAIKAAAMIRIHVWKKFHEFNKQFVLRYKIKYAKDTDFHVEIQDKLLPEMEGITN